MLSPGDVVRAPFIGATGVKRRPTVVISSALYNSSHLDVLVAELTTQLGRATTATDYILRDWQTAGLHRPSAFRLYVNTHRAADVAFIGRLSDRDWQEVQARLRLGVAVT